MNPIKFACKKDEICAAIGNVSKAVSPKSTITALEGIRLLLNGTSLELTGYDLSLIHIYQFFLFPQYQKAEESGFLFLHFLL